MNRLLDIVFWKSRFDSIINVINLEKYLTFCFSHNLGVRSIGIDTHHIVPKSLAEDLIHDTDNIVYLNPADHLYAHQLLCTDVFSKESEEMFKMSSAFCRMTTLKQYDPTDEQIRLASEFRLGTKHPESVKEKMKHPRKTNGLAGKRWINDGAGNRELVDPEEFDSKIKDGWISGMGSINK